MLFNVVNTNMKTNIKIWRTFEQLSDFWSNFWATLWEILSNFIKNFEHLVDSPNNCSSVSKSLSSTRNEFSYSSCFATTLSKASLTSTRYSLTSLAGLSFSCSWTKAFPNRVNLAFADRRCNFAVFSGSSATLVFQTPNTELPRVGMIFSSEIESCGITASEGRTRNRIILVYIVIDDKFGEIIRSSK